MSGPSVEAIWESIRVRRCAPPKAVLRAVGTQFAVDMRPRQTTVTVVEGRVSVVSHSGDAQMALLAAADRFVIDASGGTKVQHGINVRSTLSWTHRQLMFERQPLAEVADEFNRYNRDRVEIRDESLRTQEVTGGVPVRRCCLVHRIPVGRSRGCRRSQQRGHARRTLRPSGVSRK